MFLLILNFSVLFTMTYSAKILCIFPTPLESHQAVYRPLVQALAEMGHEMFVASTHPMYLDTLNVIDIDWSFGKKTTKEMNEELSKSLFTNWGFVFKVYIEMLERQITDEHFKYVINNVEFDLLIVEAQNHWMYYMLKHKFKIPMIGIISFETSALEHDYLGNPNHFLMYPDHNCVKLIKKSYWDRIIAGTKYLGVKMFNAYWLPKMNEWGKKLVSESRDFWDLDIGADVLFHCMNPSLGFTRPLVPFTVDITGIHMKPLQELDEEISNHLDRAKNGAILFCLGNNVLVEHLPSNVQDIFLKALGELPLTVILKSEIVEKLPPYVFTYKHLQQREILAHPNVKLFITHGGYHSLVEAVSHSIPLVGIPFMGDQIINAQRIVHYNIGESLDLNDLTKESFKKTIMKVINDPKYKENIMRMSEQIFDNPETPLERAVWWTNYVLKHNGTKHLRPVVQNLPIYQYFYLDIILVLITPPIVIFWLLFICITRLCFWCRRIKTKTE